MAHDICCSKVQETGHSFFYCHDNIYLTVQIDIFQTPFVPYSKPATKVSFHNTSHLYSSPVERGTTQTTTADAFKYQSKQAYSKDRDARTRAGYPIKSSGETTDKPFQKLKRDSYSQHAPKPNDNGAQKATHEDEQHVRKRQALFVSEDFQVTPLKKYSHSDKHKHRKRSHLSSYHPQEHHKVTQEGHHPTDSKRQRTKEPVAPYSTQQNQGRCIIQTIMQLRTGTICRYICC